ncbi:hypothetical protein D3C79_835400 [compost metagenome]
MLIGARGDADGQVDDLAIAPVHPFGELQQAHAGGMHQLAGFGGAMGDGNTLAEEGRALCFTGLQPGQIAVGDQAITDQALGQQVQCRRLIHSRLAHGYLLHGELEHDLLLCSTRWVLRYCCELFSVGPVAMALSRRMDRQKIAC